MTSCVIVFAIISATIIHWTRTGVLYLMSENVPINYNIKSNVYFRRRLIR